MNLYLFITKAVNEIPNWMESFTAAMSSNSKVIRSLLPDYHIYWYDPREDQTHDVHGTTSINEIIKASNQTSNPITKIMLGFQQGVSEYMTFETLSDSLSGIYSLPVSLYRNFTTDTMGDIIGNSVHAVTQNVTDTFTQLLNATETTITFIQNVTTAFSQLPNITKQTKNFFQNTTDLMQPKNITEFLSNNLAPKNFTESPEIQKQGYNIGHYADTSLIVLAVFLVGAILYCGYSFFYKKHSDVDSSNYLPLHSVNSNRNNFFPENANNNETSLSTLNQLHLHH